MGDPAEHPVFFLANALSVIDRRVDDLLSSDAADEFPDYFPRECFLSLQGSACRVSLVDFFHEDRLKTFRRMPMIVRSTFGGVREALWFVKENTALEVLLAVDEDEEFSRADLTLFMGETQFQAMNWLDQQIAEVATSEVAFLGNRLLEIAKVVGKDSVRSLLPAGVAEVLA